MTAEKGRNVDLVKAPRPQITPNKIHVDQRLIGLQTTTATAHATSKATRLSFPRRAISGNQPGKTNGHSAGAAIIARPVSYTGKRLAATKAAIHRDSHAAKYDTARKRASWPPNDQHSESK